MERYVRYYDYKTHKVLAARDYNWGMIPDLHKIQRQAITLKSTILQPGERFRKIGEKK